MKKTIIYSIITATFAFGLCSCDQSPMERAEKAKTPHEIMDAYIANLKDVKDDQSTKECNKAYRVLKEKMNNLKREDKEILFGLVMKTGEDVANEKKRIREANLELDELYY